MNPTTRANEWPQWRDAAELLAQLANASRLSDLEHWQKEKLVSDVQNLDSFGRSILQSGVGKKAAKQMSDRLKLAVKDKSFVSSWRGRDIPYHWLAIWDVHPFAHQMINALVDNGEIDVQNLKDKLYLFRPVSVQHDQRGGVAVKYDVAEMALYGLFGALWQTITLYPFPFRRCPTCRQIFIPLLKKQKFCAKACANKSLGPRTEYFRDYMRERRKAAGS
jgi:hypothetical protein